VSQVVGEGVKQEEWLKIHFHGGDSSRQKTSGNTTAEIVWRRLRGFGSSNKYLPLLRRPNLCITLFVPSIVWMDPPLSLWIGLNIEVMDRVYEDPGNGGGRIVAEEEESESSGCWFFHRGMYPL